MPLRAEAVEQIMCDRAPDEAIGENSWRWRWIMGIAVCAAAHVHIAAHTVSLASDDILHHVRVRGNGGQRAAFFKEALQPSAGELRVLLQNSVYTSGAIVRMTSAAVTHSPDRHGATRGFIAVPDRRSKAHPTTAAFGNRCIEFLADSRWAADGWFATPYGMHQCAHASRGRPDAPVWSPNQILPSAYKKAGIPDYHGFRRGAGLWADTGLPQFKRSADRFCARSWLNSSRSNIAYVRGWPTCRKNGVSWKGPMREEALATCVSSWKGSIAR